MTKGRYLLIGALICLLALLSAGCETMNPEWSGNMPNESGRHVQPQDLDAPSQNNDAVRPFALMRALRVQPSGATDAEIKLKGLMGWVSPRATITMRGLARALPGSLATGNASSYAILPFKNARPADEVAHPSKP
ncbi:MAG: hypothetical protein ACRD2G_20110 [Terriglobia bacterium]